MEAVRSIPLSPLFSRALQLRWARESPSLGVWNPAGTGCGVFGKTLSLSGASTSPPVQWRRLNLVKFLAFPWQCKYYSHNVCFLLPFLLASYSSPHLLLSLVSLFPLFISSLLPSPPLLCFSLSLLLVQAVSELQPCPSWLAFSTPPFHIPLPSRGRELQKRPAMDIRAVGVASPVAIVTLGFSGTSC